jgi:2-polyprenyl-6-methoxyphenol hydroxylase-like FAD-dependent oxidoreductase
VVIGADGVHSIVRDIIIGPDAPIHKGRIAYRAVFPSALMGGRDIGDSRTKWWGIDRHIVIYYTRRDKSEVYFVTSVPESAAFTRTSVRCWNRVPTVTNGPFSSASRWRSGATVVSFCLATRAIR